MLRKRKLWVAAIKQSDLPVSQKLWLRLLLLNDNYLEAVDDFLLEKASITEADVATMADGKIIEIIIENLPEIIEFIKLLIGLFS